MENVTGFFRRVSCRLTLGWQSASASFHPLVAYKLSGNCTEALSIQANVTISLTANDRDQVTQFIIHVLRISHGVGNSRPQEFAIALAKAMDRHPRGAFAQAQLCGQFRIG